MQAKSTNTQLSSLEIGPLVATITQQVTNQVSGMSHSLDIVYSSTVYYYYYYYCFVVVPRGVSTLLLVS